jgi:flagellar secretion chaperone FliS
MTPPGNQKEYLLQRVLTASPVELVGILYETALQAVDEALAALQSGDIAARGQAITKSIQAVAELRTALRREVNPQYCDTLAGLYDYMQRQLMRAHSDKSGGLLREVSRLLQTLLEGWTGAMRSLSASKEPEPAPAPEEVVAAVSGVNPYAAAGPSSRVRSWQL